MVYGLMAFATKHVNDPDFNAAFYARILLQILCDKNGFGIPKEKQKYFADIPNYGTKKLLFVKNKEQQLNGMNYVTKLLERISDETGEDCGDIERKVATYRDKIVNAKHMLLKAGNRKQCGVALDDINVAFFRVLYKEWYQGRWDGLEISLSRVILSVSEPYILLQSPAIWPYQENKLLDLKISEFEAQSEDYKEKMLKNIFSIGLSETEIVLGGALTDYSYKKELTGFITTYIAFPAIKKEHALYANERNIRLLFHRNDEFTEKINCNLLVYNTGVESFKGSKLMNMFSKRALNHFGWKLIFDNGLKVINSNNDIIGRFEYYYGVRTDIGNNIHMNQPIIQRWVITRQAFDEIRNMFIYDLKQVAHAEVINIR